ncbi:MAG: Rrf2 family transcriptional regulator [Firmicutes bacterium]|nr:Rrf2 family transcriptional regulator [Bacillota bacterium]
MDITRKAEYAISILLELAQTGPDYVPSREVGKRQGIPQNLVPQLVSILSREGWIDALRGPRGGVRLAVDPATITLASVIEAIEGPIMVSRCLVQQGKSCPNQTKCPLRNVWAEAQRKVLEVLGDTSIADLVRAQRELAND